jgi:hypothetical protein
MVEFKIEPKSLILGRGIRDREGSRLYVLPTPKQYEHIFWFSQQEG